MDLPVLINLGHKEWPNASREVVTILESNDQRNNSQTKYLMMLEGSFKTFHHTQKILLALRMVTHHFHTPSLT